MLRFIGKVRRVSDTQLVPYKCRVWEDLGLRKNIRGGGELATASKTYCRKYAQAITFLKCEKFRDQINAHRKSLSDILPHFLSTQKPICLPLFNISKSEAVWKFLEDALNRIFSPEISNCFFLLFSFTCVWLFVIVYNAFGALLRLNVSFSPYTTNCHWFASSSPRLLDGGRQLIGKMMSAAVLVVL